jgi:uncharacterized protein (DUF1015 family)
MATIYPFRGIRYDPQVVGDIAQVVAQPYDKIDKRLREIYHRRHPKNIVRIIKGETFPDDTPENSVYTRARDCFRQWLAEGTLRQDAVPALYVYDETYPLPSGCPKTRRGMIAVAELEEFSKGGIIPHERTLAGPKADRLNLTRAAAGQFGQIFMLYPDPKNRINTLLGLGAQGQPVFDFRDDSDGAEISHRLWIVTRPQIVAAVAEEMKPKPLFIADGHHRYETALNYRNEMRAAGRQCAPGSENFNNSMMTFVNFDDEGLTILPTHRMVFGLASPDWAGLVRRLGENFTLREIPSLAALLAELDKGKDRHVFGFQGDGKFRLLTLKDDRKPEKIVPGAFSPAWKNLDVSILHTLILDSLLGIDAAKLEAQTNVRYYRSAAQASAAVEKGEGQMVFYLNPTRAAQVKEVAGQGEKMPQKSTDFFPKILSGLLIHKYNLL